MRSMLPHPQEHSSASCGTCFHNLRSSALNGKIFTTYYLLPITCNLLPMKKETIKYIIQLIVAILTAIGSTITVVSCANGHVGEGFAFLGGTIAGTGYLQHIASLV